jgi:hypothetical protein
VPLLVDFAGTFHRKFEHSIDEHLFAALDGGGAQSVFFPRVLCRQFGVIDESGEERSGDFDAPMKRGRLSGWPFWSYLAFQHGPSHATR